MMSFFVGIAIGATAAGLAFKDGFAVKYLLLPAATILFLHALGVVEQAPHWAITTVEIVVAATATLVSLLVWFVWWELEKAK